MEKRRKATFCDLPEDAIPEILSRCPVKSLLRFKTVCKSWLLIISDPQFIQSHCHIAAQEKPWILVNTKSLDVSPKYPKLFEYIFLPRGIDHCTEFVACAKGIICLKFDGVIYLWNPSIRRYRRIPDPKKGKDVYGTTLGFGYDSVSNDFKVVYLEHYYVSTKVVQLFSKNDGVWRKIVVNIPLSWHVYAKCQFINGFLYFVPMGSNGNELISFDLHAELFGLVPLPCSLQQKRSELLDFKGSLAIMFIDSIGHGSVKQDISLWTLQDCAEVSWIKKFTIEAADLCRIEKPSFTYGLWVNLHLGDGIFYERNCFRGRFSREKSPISHMWYNYEKKEGSCIDLLDGKFLSIFTYTQSLFWFETTGLTTSNSCEEERRRSKRLAKLCMRSGQLGGN